MQASLFPITQENLALLHPQARTSVFWELAPETTATVEPAFEKEAWLSTTLLEHGRCGFNIGYRNGTPAISTVIFSRREAAPGAATLPTAPVAPDAALISSLFIEEVFRGVGMESVLLDAALMDLMQLRFSAVEAFGLREVPARDLDDLDPGTRGLVSRRRHIGLIDYTSLISAGFEVVADHPVLPRLRMELPPEHGLLSAEAARLLLAEVYAR